MSYSYCTLKFVYILYFKIHINTQITQKKARYLIFYIRPAPFPHLPSANHSAQQACTLKPHLPARGHVDPCPAPTCHNHRNRYTYPSPHSPSPLSAPLRSRAPRRHCRLPLATRKRIRWGSVGSSAMWWRALRARRRLSGSRPASTAAAVEKTCRAVVVPRFGGAEVLEIRQGVPVPDLKPREVLVRARAVSINPLDLRVSSPCWIHDPSMWLTGS
jgi:hypothetical protein